MRGDVGDNKYGQLATSTKGFPSQFTSKPESFLMFPFLWVFCPRQLEERVKTFFRCGEIRVEAPVVICHFSKAFSGQKKKKEGKTAMVQFGRQPIAMDRDANF